MHIILAQNAVVKECEGWKDGVMSDLLWGIDDAQAVSHLQRAKSSCEHRQSERAC